MLYSPMERFVRPAVAASHRWQLNLKKNLLSVSVLLCGHTYSFPERKRTRTKMRDVITLRVQLLCAKQCAEFSTTYLNFTGVLFGGGGTMYQMLKFYFYFFAKPVFDCLHIISHGPPPLRQEITLQLVQVTQLHNTIMRGK